MKKTDVIFVILLLFNLCIGAFYGFDILTVAAAVVCALVLVLSLVNQKMR